MLSPFVGGDYYGALIAGVTGAVADLGGRVVAIQTLDPGSHSADLCGIPDFHQPVGWNHLTAFVVVAGAVHGEYVRALQRAGKPVVLMSHGLPGVDCPTVVPDNRSGVREAVEHLIVAHGHERIAFAGNLATDDVRERHAGYLEALQARGITPDPALTVRVSDNHESGGEQMAPAVVSAHLGATAVVLGTDRNAIGLMHTLTAAGYDLPTDLAMVSFDDITATRYVTPSLSSVRQPLDVLGRAAVDLLVAQVKGDAVPSGPRYVPTVLVTRESCGCRSDAPPQHLSHEQARAQFEDVTYLQTMLNTQYQLGMDLLQTHERDPRELAWLARTPVRGGTLGLWIDGRRLEIVGDLRRDGAPPSGVGSAVAVDAFPPPALFDLADEPAGAIVFVVPVRSGTRDWGMLAAVTSIQAKTPPGRELMNQSGALLGVALDQDAMLQSLREQEEQLRWAALHDQLTGLPNRGLFRDRLGQAVKRVNREPGHRFAILFLDLDGFKTVNDTRGHAAGDDLLVQVAGRIRRELREFDTAARFGGDEFLVLLEGSPQPCEVAERLQAALARPYDLAGGSVTISASVGIAQPGGGPEADVDDLLRAADAAMYLAKSRKKQADVSVP